MADRRRGWVAVILAAAAAYWLAAPYLASAAFILDLTGSPSRVRAWLPSRARPVTSRDLQIATRQGDLAARLYEPAGGASSALVVFPGVHAGGVDEPRLATFSRHLASTGANVLSVPLPDLRAFRITPASTDLIEDATRWLAGQAALAPTGRVGLVGVSFAGGLALVAAGRPSLADKVQLVVSLGGHANLPRVLRYLCTGQLADGTSRPPHEYGTVVLLLAAIDRLVPPEQVAPLQRTVRAYLNASSEDQTDPAGMRTALDRVRADTAALPEPARTYMQWVNDGETAALGEHLLPFVDVLGSDPALSPERSPATMAPVFLLHGAGDNIIPSSETPAAAAYLRAHGNADVRWLLTPYVTHATVVDRDVGIADGWRLVRFWTAMLDAAR